MRKFLVLFFIATTFCLCMITPAVAQKDPFAPLVTDESTSTSGTTSTTGTTTTGTSSVPASSSRGAVLSPTGISADVWSAIAMLLVLTGSAFLVLDRYRALS